LRLGKNTGWSSCRRPAREHFVGGCGWLAAAQGPGGQQPRGGWGSLVDGDLG